MTQVESQQARAIGEKLRAARKHRHMSLRALAQKAEISASMLSQIETGKAYPSVRSIYAIAAALALPVDYFFPAVDHHNGQAASGAQDGQPREQRGREEQAREELTASDMRITRLERLGEVESAARGGALPSIVHADERPTIELKGGVTWARLTALVEEGAEFLEISYAPGSSSGENMSHHKGREFGLILEGALTVELGDNISVLGPGDSIIFDSTTPHRLANQGAESVRAIWVVLEKR